MPHAAARCCQQGTRLAPCSHVMAVIYMGCTLSWQPATFKPTHFPVNLVDPGMYTTGDTDD